MLIILSAFYIFNFKQKEEIVEIDLVQASEPVIPKEELEPEMIVVDIKGAVKKPGAYQVKTGDRVKDLIKQSGGLKENADTLLINLSKKLIDEMVIVVHTKEQVNDAIKKEPLVVYLDKDCVCPDVVNDACVVPQDERNYDQKISLNLATIEQLMTLPGIGEAKAKAIIEYREANKFNDTTDLLNINGIGESIFEKLKNFITI